MMDEGDEARSFCLMIEPMKKVIRLYREVLKEDRMEEIWGILNLEMDPVYEQLCNARRVMARMLSEKDCSGWTIASARDVVRICKGVYGLIELGEIAEGSQISERGLKRILSQYGLRLDARRTVAPDCHRKALIAGIRRGMPLPMGAGGQCGEVVHGAGPIFGRACGSGNTGGGYRAEGWCDGGDESIGGDPEQLSGIQGTDAVSRADGAISDARRV
jgi:hypothetical protein